MSLFGTSPPEDDAPSITSPARASNRNNKSLFDSPPSSYNNRASSSLFNDDDDIHGQDDNNYDNGYRDRNGHDDINNGHSRFGGASSSPTWSMPTPRKQQSRAQLVRGLIPSPSSVPASYAEAFEALAADGEDAVGPETVFAYARLEDMAVTRRILDLVSPEGEPVGRPEFHVLMALVGLAQEGEVVSLDGVDERRRNLPQPKLVGLLTSEPESEPAGSMSAEDEGFAARPRRASTTSHPHSRSNSHVNIKTYHQPQAQPHNHSNSQSGSISYGYSQSPSHQPDQMPSSHTDISHQPQHSTSQPAIFHPAMDPEDDPWGAPDLHKNHNHSTLNRSQSHGNSRRINGATNGHNNTSLPTAVPRHTSALGHNEVATSNPQGVWGYFDGSPDVGSAAASETVFHPPIPNPFRPSTPGGGINNGISGGNDTLRPPGHNRSASSNAHPQTRTISGRSGASMEENIVVTLMPEKEGIFMFQHHNYEVTSQRRASKVVRRYSDFVWLLDCLHKRYPFRALPLLPPKRIGVNGSHMSNDGAFIEKRRRGLARFLNALVRHPVLSQDQLAVMFLTVPTELAVWRKQATISVKDEFDGRELPPTLEESLPSSLEDLFSFTRAGIKRSAELYISVCTIMDRVVKRQEGVAADHGRLALILSNLTEASASTYATDSSEVPLLNDGLTATSKHLRTCQALMEDESRGWDEGVLEDLKRQRDTLVSVRELYDRRERLDKDNIPFLERRIQTNETKLASLRGKPEGMVKPGEVEKVAEAIIKDKESIVQQHNRSIFVKEALRDELRTLQSSQYHISRWNQDWAGERVKYAEMLADNWRRLIDELEGMPLGD